MKRFVFLPLAVLASSMVLAQEVPAVAPDAAPANAPAEAPLVAPTDTPVDAQVVTPVAAPDVPSATPPEVPPEMPAATPPGEPPAASGESPAAAPSVAPPAGTLPPPLPLVPAGRWDGDFSAALTAASGNTTSQSLTLGLDAVYQRPDDKLSLSGQYLESSARSQSNGVVTTSVTALQWRLGGRYDRDITPQEFGFIGLDFSQDQIRQLALRSVISTGLGRHVVKSTEDQWDVYGGLTYREDIYYPPGVQIDNAQQTRYETVETLFGEESSHKLAEGARFKQKFVLYPGLGNSNGTRATLDAGLQVDINKIFSLNVKLQGRYDSLAEAPAEKYDLLFMTGLSVKLSD